MSKQADQLAQLLNEYPELTTGLDQLVDPENDGVVSLVGVFSLLQLRLRSILRILPQPASDEETKPGTAGE